MSHENCKNKTIEKTMKEFENKKLKQRDGKVVKDRKQAIAIALSKTEDECKLSASDYKAMELKVKSYLDPECPVSKIVLTRIIETKELIEYYLKKKNIKKCKKYQELLWTYLIRCGMKNIEISHNVWEQLNEIKNMGF
jgi:hypothetical protein